MGEMLSRMSYRELRTWQAYEVMAGPLGPRRGDFHAAIIARTMAQTFSKRKLDLSRFLLKWGRADKQAADGGSTVRDLFDSADDTRKGVVNSGNQDLSAWD